MPRREIEPGGLACSEVRDLLVLYADDACSPATAAKLERHLAACSACAAHHREARPLSPLERLGRALQRRGTVSGSPEGDDPLERLVRASQRRLALTVVAVAAVVAVAFGSVGYVTGRWEAEEKWLHLDVAWEHDAFVEVQATASLGELSLTVRRALFDREQTVIFMTPYDADGEPFRLLEPFDVRLLDPAGGAYANLGAGSGFVVFEAVDDGAAEVALEVRSPQGAAASLSIPVQKVDTEILVRHQSANLTAKADFDDADTVASHVSGPVAWLPPLLQQAGPYGFILAQLQSGRRETGVVLNLEHAPQGRIVDEYVGYLLGIDARTAASQWAEFFRWHRIIAWDEPLQLEPAPILAPPPPWSPDAGSLEPGSQGSWRAPVLAMAVTERGDKWLQHQGGGLEREGARFRATLDPLPGDARWVRIEVPNLILFRQYQRSLSLEIPPEDGPAREEPAGVILPEVEDQERLLSIPIHGRFAYDGVYIVLEELEVWTRTLVLRYRVETPRGRVITDDYPLVVLARQDGRLGRTTGSLGYPGERRGALIEFRAEPGPLELNIYAVGEDHGPLYWLLAVNP